MTQKVNVFCCVTDFGMDHAAELVKQTQFPWLMSNVYDNVTENTLADGLVTHMISWNGRKVCEDFHARTHGRMHACIHPPLSIM